MSGATIINNVLTYKYGKLNLVSDATFNVIDCDYVYDTNNTFRYIYIDSDIKLLFNPDYLL